MDNNVERSLDRRIAENAVLGNIPVIGDVGGIVPLPRFAKRYSLLSNFIWDIHIHIHIHSQGPIKKRYYIGEPLPLNQRALGSSPGAPTISLKLLEISSSLELG